MAPPNMAQFRLPSTDALHGRAFELTFEDGAALSLIFNADKTVQWAARDVAWSGEGRDHCDVVEVATGVWFVDIDLNLPALDAVTVVLNEVTGWALVIHQHREPTEEHAYGPAVQHSFYPASIGGLAQIGKAPHETRELLGRWHLYRYSPENLYEHIYLSSTKMCSHNLKTQNTQGRADCHDTSYYKVSDFLYVITWREHYSQAAMVFAENLATLTTTGKVLHPVSPDRSVSVPIGGVVMPAEVQFPAIETYDRP